MPVLVKDTARFGVYLLKQLRPALLGFRRDHVEPPPPARTVFRRGPNAGAAVNDPLREQPLLPVVQRPRHLVPPMVGDLRVFHGAPDIRMTEPVLYELDVMPAIQKVHGAGMLEHVEVPESLRIPAAAPYSFISTCNMIRDIEYLSRG
jgi:hypothetical protein